MKLHLNMYSNLQKSSQGPQLHIKTTKPQILYLLKPFTSQNSTKKRRKNRKTLQLQINKQWPSIQNKCQSFWISNKRCLITTVGGKLRKAMSYNRRVKIAQSKMSLIERLWCTIQTKLLQSQNIFNKC